MLPGEEVKVGPDGKPIEPAVAAPGTPPATPPEPETKPGPTTPATPPAEKPPDWFLGDKYKTIEEQAKGVKSAVQAEKAAELEAKALREERDALIAEKAAMVQQQQSLENPTDELITKMEAKFGKPFAQIKAEADMQAVLIKQQLAPVNRVILGQQYESTLNRMEQSSEVFKKYRPAVEAKLVGKTIEEKADSQVIKSAWNEVIAENITAIREEAIAEGKSAVTAAPSPAPETTPTGKEVPQPKVKINLSEQEQTYLKRVGGNPEEVEKFHNENLAAARGKETGWENVL